MFSVYSLCGETEVAVVGGSRARGLRNVFAAGHKRHENHRSMELEQVGVNGQKCIFFSRQ